MAETCTHPEKLQRRTQRFVGGEWHDSTIEIGCASCDALLSIGSTQYAFYTEDAARRVLEVEEYKDVNHG